MPEQAERSEAVANGTNKAASRRMRPSCHVSASWFETARRLRLCWRLLGCVPRLLTMRRFVHVPE